MVLVILILLLLFGVPSVHYYGPAGGGISIGAVLLIILILYLLGYFPRRP